MNSLSMVAFHLTLMNETNHNFHKLKCSNLLSQRSAISCVMCLLVKLIRILRAVKSELEKQFSDEADVAVMAKCFGARVQRKKILSFLSSLSVSAWLQLK